MFTRILLGSLVVIALLLSALWFTNGSQDEQPVITSFEECVAAGNLVMESYPRQCRTEEGQHFVEDVPPLSTQPEEPASTGGCAVAGCSSQLCVEANEASDIMTTCEFREEYACYRSAACERQASGQCGWTETPELQACLSTSR